MTLSTASIILIAFTALSLIAWLVAKRVIFGAITAVLILFLLATLGWLWLWVPIVAAIIGIVSLVIAAVRIPLGFMLLTGLTAIGLLLALIVGGSNLLGPLVSAANTNAALKASSNGGIDSIAFDPETDVLPGEAKCDTNLFVDHSVRTVEPGNPERKQFSTAVSIPLKGTDDAAVLSEMLNENCGNPTVLVETVDDMLLWDDSQIPGAEANKGWLNEIKATISGAPSGINSFMEARLSKDAPLTVSPLFQKYASWVNTVLLRSIAEGQQSLASVRNWEISAAWAPNTGLPVAQQAVDQESKPAWVRFLMDKNEKCLLRFGWNVEDRRLEIFPCEQPAAPGAPASDTPSNPAPPGSPPSTNSGCTEDCQPVISGCPADQPHGYWSTEMNKWICKDDGVKDPADQKNNKVGGVGDAPVQQDTISPPAASEPTPAYTTPAAPEPEITPAPEVTPVPGPQPTVAPSAQPINDGTIVPPTTCTPEAKDFGLC